MRIRPSKFKLSRIDMVGKRVQSDLLLYPWIKHQLIEKSMFRSLEILSISLWNTFSLLHLQMYNHLKSTCTDTADKYMYRHS